MSISEATRDRVLKEARRLNYRHNAVAADLRRGASRLVGIQLYSLAVSMLARKVSWFPVSTTFCLDNYDWPESAKRNPAAYQGVPSGRHQGGVNCAFADGHSKWLRTGNDVCKPERGFPTAP